MTLTRRCLVGASIEDQRILNKTFPEFEPTLRHFEVGIALMIDSNLARIQRLQLIANGVEIFYACFEFDIEFFHGRMIARNTFDREPRAG